MSIDTGQLTKRLRASGHSAAARARGRLDGAALRPTETAVRASLGAGALLGNARDERRSRAARAGRSGAHGAGVDRTDAARRRLALPVTTADGAAAVYFPACVTRTMGELDGEARRRIAPRRS